MPEFQATCNQCCYLEVSEFYPELERCLLDEGVSWDMYPETNEERLTNIEAGKRAVASWKAMQAMRPRRA